MLDFNSADKIDLSGFGHHAVAHALASQTVSNGSVTITLSDDTRITFSGITHLTRGNFT